MPGFMGIRGIERSKSRHNQDHARKEQQSAASAEFDKQAQLAEERIVAILQEQAQVKPTETRVDVSATTCGDISMLRVAEIMSRQVAVLSYDDTLLTVEGIFDCVRFRHLPVVDESGNVIGIISDRDFLRVTSPFYGTVNEQSRDLELMTKKVGTVMTHKPATIHTGYSIQDCIRLMAKDRISCLPVVEPGTTRLQGIITWKDIVQAFCPTGFVHHDSVRLKTGIIINPEADENKDTPVQEPQKTTDSGRIIQEETQAKLPLPSEEYSDHAEHGSRTREFVSSDGLPQHTGMSARRQLDRPHHAEPAHSQSSRRFQSQPPARHSSTAYMRTDTVSRQRSSDTLRRPRDTVHIQRTSSDTGRTMQQRHATSSYTYPGHDSQHYGSRPNTAALHTNMTRPSGSDTVRRPRDTVHMQRPQSDTRVSSSGGTVVRHDTVTRHDSAHLSRHESTYTPRHDTARVARHDTVRQPASHGQIPGKDTAVRRAASTAAAMANLKNLLQHKKR